MDSETQLTVPCGQCIGCRFNRAENWASRMMHEASIHEHNSFITLTYNDDHLPPDGNLSPDDVTKFLKRLRKHLKGKKILYYYCGEYGENFSRPHYHICLFGYDFSTDRFPHRLAGETPVYRSPSLEKLWPFGFSEIGSLEYDSARYVAGYVQKKVLGKKAKEHYSKIDPQTGEVQDVLPEFARMSRRPAIGLNWIKQYHSDIYNHDVCYVGDKKLRPPAYYDKWLKKYDYCEYPRKSDLTKFESIKLSRDSTVIGCSTDTARLIKTFEAKVKASQKIQRSLEGVPAHTPDSELLDYYKRSHEQQHFIEKEKKWKLLHEQRTLSGLSTTSNLNSFGLLNSFDLNLTLSAPAKKELKTQTPCSTNIQTISS